MESDQKNYDQKGKASALLLCAAGVSALFYGIVKENDPAFIIGLAFIVVGYLIIRRGLKREIEKKTVRDIDPSE